MGRTRRQLAQELSTELGISEALALQILRRIFEKLATDLVESGRIELRGFGTFTAVKRPAQTLRSPKTGQPVPVPEYRSIIFRAGASLRKRLGPKPPGEAPSPRARRSRKGSSERASSAPPQEGAEEGPTHLRPTEP